mgnify:CR=1 FL=1
MVAVVMPLAKMARYWLPPWLALAVKVSVGSVAPLMLDQLPPPFVLTCHWAVGVGLPVAAAVKLAWSPAFTVWLSGWVVMVTW